MYSQDKAMENSRSTEQMVDLSQLSKSTTTIQFILPSFYGYLDDYLSSLAIKH